MLKAKYLLLFFFLFSIIFIPKGEAFTMFSYNPYFDDNIDGTIFLYSNNIDYYYNDTCTGFTDCLIVENNATSSSNRIYIGSQTTGGAIQEWFVSDYGNLTDFHNYNDYTYYATHSLPKNREMILNLSYRWNQSIALNPYPQVIIADANNDYEAIDSFTLNSTINVWHNKSHTINPVNYDRDIVIAFIWNFDNLDSRLEINRFKAYTLDITESRTTWTSNATYERIRYCGEDIAPTYVTGGGILPENFYDEDKAWIFGIVDGELCGAFKTGDLTRAGRVLEKQGAMSYISCADYGSGQDLGQHQLYKFRNFYFGYQASQCTASWNFLNFYLIEGIQLNSIIWSNMQNATNTSGTPLRTLLFNGGIVASTPLLNATCSFYIDAGDYHYCYNTSVFYIDIDALRLSNNLTYLMNTSMPSGNQWRICGDNPLATPNCHVGSASSHFYNPTIFNDFFTYQASCTSGWSCSNVTNNETYTLSNCDVAESNYCGACYCDEDYERCDYPDITGSVCTNDYSGITTYTNDCTEIYTSCPVGSRCNQLTPQFNATHQLIQNMVDCSHCYFLDKYIDGDWVTQKSNCWNALECRNTTGTTAVGLPFLWRIVWGSGVYYYNQSIPSGLTTNFTRWTAYCINLTTGETVFIIDETGNETTEESIVEDELNVSLNETGCQNTTTTCYDSNCNPVACPLPTAGTNMFSYGAMAFGSLFGMGSMEYYDVNVAMFSLFSSLFISGLLTITIFLKKGEFSEKIFMYSFLCFLSMLTIGMNNSYLWAIYIVLIILTAGIVTGGFKKLIGG